jgi:hypothetical protein
LSWRALDLGLFLTLLNRSCLARGSGFFEDGHWWLWTPWCRRRPQPDFLWQSNRQCVSTHFCQYTLLGHCPASPLHSGFL